MNEETSTNTGAIPAGDGVLLNDIWDLYDKHPGKGVCRICKKDIATPKGGTTALHNHANSLHKKFARKRQRTTNKEKPTKPVELTNIEILKQQHPLEYRLAQLTACSGYSFNSIKNSDVIREGLSDTLKRLKSKSILPRSAKTIRSMVVNFGGKVKEAMKENIGQRLKNGEYFSCSFDEWTSVSGRRYINVNVEDKSGNVFNLGLVRITGRATADNLLLLVNERLQEFGIDSKTNIVCFTTDGCSVMQKVHRQSGIEGQLCIVHGIHLAVLDIMYKKKSKAGDKISADGLESDDEVEEHSDINDENESEDDAEEDDDEGDIIEQNVEQEANSLAETVEGPNSGFKVEQSSSHLEFESGTIKNIVSKVRKLAAHFKRSPMDNDILQNIIRTKSKYPKGLKLILDCRTRWSSLYNMLDRYYKLRACVDEAIKETKVQIKISSTEKCMVKSILKSLKPIALTVKVLCRRDSNLLKARAALKLLFHVLESHKNILSHALAKQLRTRIEERWTINSSAMYYLQTACLTDNYEEENVVIADDEDDDEEADELSPWYTTLFPEMSSEDITDLHISEIFDIHSKAEIKEHLMNLIERMCPTTLSTKESNVTPTNEDTSAPLKKAKLSFEDQLNEAVMNTEVRKKIKKSTPKQSEISKALTAEMNFHEKNNHRGPYLEKCYQMISSIKPTSVESERSFSAASALCTKVRSRFNDQTIDILSLLRHAIKF